MCNTEIKSWYILLMEYYAAIKIHVWENLMTKEMISSTFSNSDKYSFCRKEKAFMCPIKYSYFDC